MAGDCRGLFKLGWGRCMGMPALGRNLADRPLKAEPEEWIRSVYRRPWDLVGRPPLCHGGYVHRWGVSKEFTVGYMTPTAPWTSDVGACVTDG
jgi:hypothetical protein